MSAEDIEVFVCLGGIDRRGGTLWCDRDADSMRFAYASEWLENPLCFELDPALPLVEGMQRAPVSSSERVRERRYFGAFADVAPDRWGRRLMELAFVAPNERRPLVTEDILLGVSDVARQGALRFRRAGEPFLADTSGSIPPFAALPRLLAAAERVAGGEARDEDLRILLVPGSSVGGSHPKAAILDRDGHLAIAKFPADARGRSTQWEDVLLSLAGRAGIAVPEHRLESVGGRAVLISRRFDRTGDGDRVPFISAMTLLGARDHQPRSYVEMAEAMQHYCAAPEENLRRLWKQMAFNVLASNFDNHLRNHGFVRVSPAGWLLSPAYDLNPVPIEQQPRCFETPIVPGDTRASIDLAFGQAETFGLSRDEARGAARTIAEILSSGWQEEARRVGLGAGETRRMASAFEHEEMAAALACL